MSINMGTRVRVPFQINQTDLLAGTPQEFVAPISGYVSRLRVVVQTAVTTGGEIKVAVNTTDVAGLAVTVANSATVGTRYTAQSAKGIDSRVCVAGDRIRVLPHADFATAGAVNGFVEIQSADV